MTNYLLHGGTLTLAWFLIVNTVLSAAVTAWAARTTSGRNRAGAPSLSRVARAAAAAAGQAWAGGGAYRGRARRERGPRNRTFARPRQPQAPVDARIAGHPRVHVGRARHRAALAVGVRTERRSDGRQ